MRRSVSYPRATFVPTKCKGKILLGRPTIAQRFIAGITANKPVQAPPGRKKSFQIALHIFHPVLFQEHLNLLLERYLPMVFRLALNVSRRVLNAVRLFLLHLPVFLVLLDDLRLLIARHFFVMTEFLGMNTAPTGQ